MTSERNYFDLFGLPVSYQVDPEALEAAYERLSLETHPDFLTNAPPEEQRQALRLSADVNEGYRVLRDRSERAAYLLRLLAGETKLDTTALPDGFLQEMFMLQEELDEIGETAENNTGADNGLAEGMRQQVEARITAVESEQEALFAMVSDKPGIELLQTIQTNLNCTKYLQRLMERMG